MNISSTTHFRARDFDDGPHYVLCVCTMSCLYYVHCVCTMCMCLYYVYHLTTGLLDLDSGLLARSQNPEGPATGHLDPGFLGFPGS